MTNSTNNNQENLNMNQTYNQSNFKKQITLNDSCEYLDLKRTHTLDSTGIINTSHSKKLYSVELE